MIRTIEGFLYSEADPPEWVAVTLPELALW